MAAVFTTLMWLKLLASLATTSHLTQSLYLESNNKGLSMMLHMQQMSFLNSDCVYYMHMLGVVPVVVSVTLTIGRLA